MKICLAASELTPFAKTGGLGDVAAALTRSFAKRGHDVRAFLPLYGRVKREGFQRVGFLQGVPVRLGEATYRVDVWTAPLPPTGPAIYFLEQPELFGRDEIYSQRGDEHLRFALLSHAALACCQRMGFAPDVVHAHDWHTALLPLLLRTTFAWDRLFARTRSVLTLHNLAYQGVFPASVIREVGLAGAESLLDLGDLRAGRFGFLKTGLLHAGALTVVSRTHAAEVQTAEHGFGLDAYLRARGVTGIVNGVDYDDWSPETDRRIAETYSARDLSGKARCRAALLDEAGLAPDAGGPVFGVVSRLTAQKGFDLFDPVLPEILRRHDVRLVVLGSGSEEIAAMLDGIVRRSPRKAHFRRGYDDAFAHRIEAGADAFLMPSRFEPCGLNQMYSLRYGTVPIVRKTGGLADTVELADPTADGGRGTGTGIVFDHHTPQGFRWAIETAIRLYADRAAWRRLQQRGMAVDNSWDRRIEEYERLMGHTPAAR